MYLRTAALKAASACPHRAWRFSAGPMIPISTKPRVARMKRRREFLAAQRAQRKWATPGMVVQVRERVAGEKSEGDIRIGYTTSRKVGNAVARNRARRRLRACVDAVIGNVAATDLDIVVIGRTATTDRSFLALKGDLLKSLRKLGVAMSSDNQESSNVR